MRKEAFLWRSSKHLESQTLIHLCHCFNVDIMHHQCSIGSALIDGDMIWWRDSFWQVHRWTRKEW